MPGQAAFHQLSPQEVGLEGGAAGGGRNIHLFVFPEINNRDREGCLIDLVQINFVSLDSERWLVDVSRQRDSCAGPEEK